MAFRRLPAGRLSAYGCAVPVALISDSHANEPALVAVLAEIERLGVERGVVSATRRSTATIRPKCSTGSPTSAGPS
jgi:hypothetical protein